MSAKGSWSDGLIAVDWGTTNRRAYLLDQAGKNIGEFEDGLGILSLERSQFEAAVSEVRAKLGDKPMLLAGMVGSNRGWIDAPYVPCPAGIDAIAGGLVEVDPRTMIVPGVSHANGRTDVMRGEEVQVLGAVASGDIATDCLVCHPGTHNKWIAVRGGRIESFRTVMTGELFSMLGKHSTVSELLAGKAGPGAAFEDGVSRMLGGSAGITAELFSARAAFLLGRLDTTDSASFVSGLLIGEDVRVGLSDYPARQVVVMGRPKLTRLYKAAIELAGGSCAEVDGERAFLAGASNIAERLQ